ncbi:MAG: hypothetical protein JRG94_05715 [Deltaproteobacteria bacterium]|nr:hypothetical protein [Deltaproteobacteria bacterium]MBW2291790.1 hypothetical protein [Deltaproteobacteria bacterium]MBW2723729.1 hypothetical protein [Deltaproteobacteria bacterium]
MSNKRKFHVPQKLVVTTFSGGVSDDEILSYYRDLYESPEWEPGYHEFVDLRDVDMSRVSTDCLKDLTLLVQGYMKSPEDGSKSAVLAPDDLPFALARFYESASEDSPEQVHVFRNKHEALSWLDVGADLLD